ncbi:hypothetical protein M409DRAFT_68409 [Zasmidium cellare ATCC 36951]|uniref:Amino acid transporter transmembrane domain-containing protein n=1 Tax=Zasmidium cellare ATCC 36951 TaxID=1080233 RepID=A0A6A6C9G7_ZASCE|nr:uncharacterized protein M409DRAFT_68409 [Zasmidium cellare ATCC 36951]KAF2163463.1 hypothetical protein M409DRAFT_68409 [Zasmidium cellare ATCC 36951]
MKTPFEKQDASHDNVERASVHGGESVTISRQFHQQDVFTAPRRGDVNFRGVSWPAATVLVAKFQIGLGALSIPSTFHVLGFFPGILSFVILALITTGAGFVCGNARQYYPRLHSIADASDLLFGPITREVVGCVYYLYLALTTGAGLLTTSVALNALSEHGTCSVVFVAVISVACFILGTGFRTLERVAWISWAGVTCIFVALCVTTIACLAQNRPAAALPAPAPLDMDVWAFPEDTTFTQAMIAVSNQLFAMREPQKFTRALVIGQSFIVLTNIAVGSIVYAKVGQYLASPALGSAGPLIKKVSYGIALPGLLVTAIIYSHIAGKYCLVRILRGTRHLQSNTVTHWAVWIGAMPVTVVFGFIIVNLVPFSGDFLSLVGALVNPIFTNVVPGFMILFFIAKRPSKVVNGQEHWALQSLQKARQDGPWLLLWLLAVFMIATGVFIMVAGTYATVLSIKQSYDDGSIGGVFSCADNSNT